MSDLRWDQAMGVAARVYTDEDMEEITLDTRCMNLLAQVLLAFHGRSSETVTTGTPEE